MNSETHFNPETFLVMDRITGEEVPMQFFIEKVSGGYWEKAFADVLAHYIGVTGSSYNKVLAHLIESKDIENRVFGTQQEIADKLKVNKSAVSKVMVLLKKKGMVKIIRNGCYMLTPKMIRHGGRIRGVIMMKVWEELK